MARSARQAINLAASGGVVVGDGRVVGIFVTTSSSLTIKLWDNPNAASGNVLLPTTAAITAPTFYAFSVDFVQGCYCQFVAGTGTVTIVYERGG